MSLFKTMYLTDPSFTDYLNCMSEKLLHVWMW